MAGISHGDQLKHHIYLYDLSVSIAIAITRVMSAIYMLYA